MRNARLDEAQAGIKVSERNINSLRYTDDTTFFLIFKINFVILIGGYLQYYSGICHTLT